MLQILKRTVIHQSKSRTKRYNTTKNFTHGQFSCDLNRNLGLHTCRCVDEVGATAAVQLCDVSGNGAAKSALSYWIGSFPSYHMYAVRIEPRRSTRIVLRYSCTSSFTEPESGWVPIITGKNSEGKGDSGIQGHERILTWKIKLKYYTTFSKSSW